jgi:hypothetical protein
MKKLIKRLSLIIVLLTIPLCSCISVGGSSAKTGGGFDLVKLLQNPFVIIIAIALIVWFMWTKGRK